MLAGFFFFPFKSKRFRQEKTGKVLCSETQEIRVGSIRIYVS